MKKDKRLLLFLALVLAGALLFSSVPASAGENPGHGKSLAEARKALEQELLPLAGAGFVGITHSEADGKITVFVENEQAKQRMPSSFEGYAVRTKVTGKIQAFSTQVAEPLIDVSAERRGEVRPLVGGTSLSAYVTKGEQIYLYAGTLGIVTYNDKILSNAHVIAMNPETGGFLATGTPVLQPGTHDGGRLVNRVGELEAYIPIDFAPNAENYADAAIGSINVSVNASPGEQFSEGGNYWIEGWTDVSLGDTVRKSGRTSGVTTGEVIHTNVAVVVSYGSKSAYFVDQIVVTQDNWSFAQPGDSGSAVDKDGEFVGLLFAGSADCTVICKAEHIIDGLNITLEPPEGSLTITSTPGGNVTEPGKGLFLYDVGTVVELVAEPDAHYHFVEWTGNVSTIANVTAPSTNITMNDSYSITANFELDEGWYWLTISSTPGGNVTQPGEGTFVCGNSTGNSTVVELFAVPDAHYHFVEWTGNVSTIANVTAPSTNITMNDSYSITANFELDEGWYTLTISSTPGGNVTEPGEGTFVCGNSTGNSTVVELFAVPDAHYHFVEWTGNVSTIANVTAPSTNITMNDSYSITANFELDEGWYTLTISSTPGGNVTQPGEGTFVCGNSTGNSTVVELFAVPDAHYHFVEWTGNVSTIANVTAPSTNITMNDSYSITANFELDEGWYTLTISSTPGGNVTEPGEGTFVCGNSTGNSTVVELFAVPDAHYHFVEWTGNVSTIANITAPSTNITMNDSYSITANFELDEGWYTLTISSTESGNVTIPGEGTSIYFNGTTVPLFAQPYEGYEFVKWTGDVSTIADVYAASTTITMNSSYSITANFESWHPEPMALLMIASTTGGSVTTPGEGTFLYPLGADVSLIAVPDEGRQFVRWWGDVDTIVDVYAASTTITVDSPCSIGAQFSGGCFILTAAYGTPVAEEIQILREFRDEYLLPSQVGEALVAFYYKVSPLLAEFITEHPSLKPIVRAGLLPAVALSTVAVNTTPVEKIAIVGLLVLGSVVVAIWATRRRGRGPEYT